MKVIQSISGDKELIDFAVTEDNKTADIYTMHVSSLKKDDIQSKINEYITLIDKNVPWRNLKKETNTKFKVSDELFNIVSAFLMGSTRGRSNSLFEDDSEQPPRKKRKTVDNSRNRNDDSNDDDDDGDNNKPEIVFLEIDFMNNDEYKNMEELITAINENIERRKGQLLEWSQKWENMTPEEIDKIDKAYEEQLKKEQEEDPDYNPNEELFEDSEDSDSDSDSDDEEESCEDSDSDSENDSESIINQAIADVFNEVKKEADEIVTKEEESEKKSEKDKDKDENK